MTDPPTTTTNPSLVVVVGQPAIDFAQFSVYWERMVARAHDETARFVFTLAASRPSSGSADENNGKGGTEDDLGYLTRE
jgi:hypothetical protein